MAMQVEVVSPERVLFSGEADMVVARSEGGDIAFLSDHAPFLGALGVGLVRVKLSDGNDVKVAVHGGFVEVRDNHVIILSDVAELADQIDADRARVALAAAEEKLRAGTDADAEAALRRAQTRLELVG
ncbi:MAG TPA: ATP synthase F1 subunit epsilon [Acidimicrobiales bacterium]|nr:ATP synthase F1 subunit epsilon [Acidimicrobiales bacterium]